MKNLIKVMLLFVMCVTIINCTEDDSPIATVITTADLTTNADENISQGSALGTVTGSSSTDKAVTFSITTQSPSGALAINATSGVLTVSDASAFDYETNTQITATVKVAEDTVSENATVTININNLEEGKKGDLIIAK
ncbi:cadherin repeat domain-containing protein [Polaribacter sp. Q13]|uniref:cadherin repeat domain-containing protein n=1 Tax=Polaribacter sp. Q13 TaxID=2806551 RepID=UPI00193B0AC7|nr:cadherin repeat domain-containing protein [Polaribacter sp. Q13]QVY67206.1 cadherin repeat domain-containing protein [Polaribacter sp. Q13]